MNSLNEYDTIEYDFDYYGPAHTVTIGWLMVATNTMTYRLMKNSSFSPLSKSIFLFFVSKGISTLMNLEKVINVIICGLISGSCILAGNCVAIS